MIHLLITKVFAIHELVGRPVTRVDCESECFRLLPPELSACLFDSVQSVSKLLESRIYLDSGRNGIRR